MQEISENEDESAIPTELTTQKFNKFVLIIKNATNTSIESIQIINMLI